MSANGIAQIVFYLVVLTILTPPLGAFIARVYEGKRIPGLSTVLGPVERGTYRLLRIDPEREQNWKGYAGSVLVFSAVGFVLLYLILRLQGHLPLNPPDLPGMSWSLAFNTSASFITNTNWQFYGGRVDAVLPEPDAGAHGAELHLGRRGHGRAGRGHPRLRPAGHRGARQLLGRPGAHHALRPAAPGHRLDPDPGSQGVMQTFSDPVTYQTLEARTLGATDAQTKQPVTQTIVRGPVASQIAIKQLGTNGGGYYNTNSATPFENPTPLSNFFEMLAILLIPAALTYTFGIMVGSRGQGWALYAAMMVILVAGIFAALPFEQRGSQVLKQTGVELSATPARPAATSRTRRSASASPTRSSGARPPRPPPTARSTAATTPGPAARRWCRSPCSAWGRWCSAGSARASTGCCCWC